MGMPVQYTSTTPVVASTPAAITRTPAEVRGWGARRNLARQVDELVAAGHVAVVRELIRSDATRTRVTSALALCTSSTLQILAVETQLRMMARTPTQHQVVTRSVAFMQALAEQLILTSYDS